MLSYQCYHDTNFSRLDGTAHDIRETARSIAYTADFEPLLALLR
jgi:hypothetical protein